MNGAVSKTVVRIARTEGSNPSLSANENFDRCFMLRTAAFLILFVVNVNLFSQSGNWVTIYEGAVSKISIDISKINSYKGDIFYVWAETEVDPPMIIESVPGRIYKYRTYYLFNKKLLKYSIVSIIYYDKKGNVLTSFNYNVNSKVEAYKFNYPVLPGSDEEKILNACVGFMKNKTPFNK